MPKEKFYNPDRYQGDGLPPDLTVTWGPDQSDIEVSGSVALDYSGAGRLIRALQRGRDQIVRKSDGIELVLDAISDLNKRVDEIELAGDARVQIKRVDNPPSLEQMTGALESGMDNMRRHRLLRD